MKASSYQKNVHALLKGNVLSNFSTNNNIYKEEA
jgi:hypothetical protein